MDRNGTRFPQLFCSENRICTYKTAEIFKIRPRSSPNATPVGEFALFGVFAGRHSKVLKFIKFTLLLARARARFLKINKLHVPVARVWGTSANPKGPGLQKYARQNRKSILNPMKLHNFIIILYSKFNLSNGL